MKKQHRCQVSPAIFLLLLLFAHWACTPEASVGKFDAGQQAKTQAEIVAELEKVDLETTRSKAESGDALAQTDMGLFHAFGIHVPQDSVEAASWFMTAAEQGDCWAMNNLAVFFLSGSGGLNKDHIEAHKWLTLAYWEAFHSKQNYAAGFFKKTLQGIEYYWYWSARKKVSESQQRAREWFIEKHGDPEKFLNQVSLERAKKGDSDAVFQIGDTFDRGQVVPQDNLHAYKWFHLCYSNHRLCPSKRDLVGTRMPKEDIAEGQRLAEEMQKNK